MLYLRSESISLILSTCISSYFANVSRAVHGHRALQWQPIIHHAEDALIKESKNLTKKHLTGHLFHFPSIPRSTNHGNLLLNVERNEYFRF